MLDYSVVAPIRDEETVVGELAARLVRVLEQRGGTFEIIFVTDVNRDRTFTVLRELHAREPRVKVLKLARSGGQHVAVLAGLHRAAGRTVVVMDGDLEDLPEDIPLLLDRLGPECDIAYGLREQKNDTVARNFYSALFNRMMTWLSDSRVEHNTCMFRAMTRRVVDELLRYGEQEPALTGLMSLIGLPSAAVPVTSAARGGGRSKYTLRRMVDMAISVLLSFSTKPIRFISLLGLAVSAFSFLFLAGVIVYGLRPHYQGAGFLTVAALVTFFGGMQLLAIGLIGEYIGRIFVEAKRRPLYTVEAQLGWD